MPSRLQRSKQPGGVRRGLRPWGGTLSSRRRRSRARAVPRKSPAAGPAPEPRGTRGRTWVLKWAQRPIVGLGQAGAAVDFEGEHAEGVGAVLGAQQVAVLWRRRLCAGRLRHGEAAAAALGRQEGAGRR